MINHFMALCHGATLHLWRHAASLWLDALLASDATYVQSTPSALALVPASLPRSRYIALSEEPLPLRIGMRWALRGVFVASPTGVPECTVDATVNELRTTDALAKAGAPVAN